MRAGRAQQRDSKALAAAEQSALVAQPVQSRGEFCKVVSCSPLRAVCKDGDAAMYLPLGWVRMSPEDYCANNGSRK